MPFLVALIVAFVISVTFSRIIFNGEYNNYKRGRAAADAHVSWIHFYFYTIHRTEYRVDPNSIYIVKGTALALATFFSAVLVINIFIKAGI